MQEQHINQLIDQSGLGSGTFDPNHFKILADQIKKDLPDLPEGGRTPTEFEVMQMSAWATAYRKGHPQATERMIRRAVQKKFKVKIIK